jgi:hypothetical protein
MAHRSELTQDGSLRPRDSIVFYGIFSILLICPLAFGAVEPWSISLLEVASAVLFAVWVWRQASLSEVTIHWNRLFPPILVFAALVLLQLVTGKTAYRYATLSDGLLYVAYGLLCFLVVQSLRATWQIKMLTACFSLYGLAVATFALLQGLASNGKLYWLRAPHGGGWIYGPYVNHNHYAGLMEMLFPIPLVFSLTSYAKGGIRRVAILAAALMATTIFLSGSRGGMVSFFCQIIFFLAMLLGRQSRVPIRGRMALVFFAVIFISLLAWIGGNKLTERLMNTNSAKTELSQDLRLQIDRDLLRIFPHRPLLGWGLGTFADVYPQYRILHHFLFRRGSQRLPATPDRNRCGGVSRHDLVFVVSFSCIRKEVA